MGVVHDESGLNEVAFAVFAEEGVYQLSLTHCLVRFHMQPAARFAQLLLAFAGNVETGLLADGIRHRYSAERAAEADLLPPYFEFRGAVYGECHLFDHLLGEVHHPEVILVGDVYLHHREFGVVGAVHSLVAEILGEFIDTVEAPHDEPLEVEFVGDAQVEVRIERIVVRDEGTCRGAARYGLQNGGLYLQVAAFVEETAHGGDDFGPLGEYFPYLRVHHKVHIALTVTRVGVGEGIVYLAVLLLDHRQRTDGFAQYGEFAAVYREFTRLGDESEALHADEVADVEQFFEYGIVEGRVTFGTDIVAADVHLYAARVVL